MVVFKVLVEKVVGILDARRGTDTVVQASRAEAGASDAHPSHRVQGHVVASVDLGQ